jgi:hypothetical protein
MRRAGVNGAISASIVFDKEAFSEHRILQLLQEKQYVIFRNTYYHSAATSFQRARTRKLFS